MKLHLPLLILLIIITACQQDDKENLPNIVLILADDMGYSDIGCFGSEVPTPNIDFLANHGLVMTQFYNAARCCPTRASLLTGMYPHQAGMGDMVEGRLRIDSTFLPAYQGWLKKSIPTIAELLKESGYQTFISGKWHVGDPPEYWPGKRGFDRSFSLINGASNYFNLEPWIHKDQEIILTLDGKKIRTGEDFYMTTAIADHALDFIRSGTVERPFFLYLPFTAPHWPLHALPEDIEKFEGNYLDGWDNLRRSRFAKMKELSLLDSQTCLSDAYFANALLTPDWDTLQQADRKIWDKRMAVYAAQIYRMDREIGRLIVELRKRKELDNTLIIFLSDNGATQAAIYLATGWYADRSGEIGTENSFDAYGARWANVSNVPLELFKHWTTEGGIATPFIAFWPEKIKPFLDKENYAHIIDILPTCLEAANSLNNEDRKRLPGTSLFPLFEGENLKADRPLFWEHQGNWAVREGRWKLLFTREVNREKVNRLELFDLLEDRSECRDISDQHPGRVEEMKNMYTRWAEKVGVEPWDSLILARPL